MINSNIKTMGDVRRAFDIISPAQWLAYTPTWGADTTPPTLGNGTVKGYYYRIGPLCHATLRLDFGGTSLAGTGAWNFTLPMAWRNSGAVIGILGSAIAFDIVPGPLAAYPGVCRLDSNTATLRAWCGNAAAAAVGVGVPFAWGGGDVIEMSITYPI